jgi:hypothetical protein
MELFDRPQKEKFCFPGLINRSAVKVEPEVVIDKVEKEEVVGKKKKVKMTTETEKEKEKPIKERKFLKLSKLKE